MRTVQVRNIQSLLSSLGTWLPVILVSSCGESALCRQRLFSGDPKSRGKPWLPAMPPDGWAEVGAGVFRGTRLGTCKRCTLLLAHPAAVHSARAPRPCGKVVAAHPQPGRSLHLHRCWSFLYACLSTSAVEFNKIKILPATGFMSLCTSLYR